MEKTATIELGPNAARVCISRSGHRTAPAVIALHGVPGSRADLECLAPYTHDELQLICCDMPGFGDSDLGDADSPQGWGQIVEELADRLDLERFSLLAHSLGGGAAMLLAHRLPARVERLVLLCSMGVSPHQLFRQTPPEAFRELAAALSAADSRAGVVEMMRGFYASAGFEAPSDWRRLQRQLELGASTDFPSLRRAASEIKAPTTIIQTVDDPHLELELARELAQIISGSQLVELSHGGHYPQRTHPREVAQLLTTALR